MRMVRFMVGEVLGVCGMELPVFGNEVNGGIDCSNDNGDFGDNCDAPESDSCRSGSRQ